MATIMIVEDNELNMKLFNDLLTVKGHNLILSRDGIGVIKIAEQQQPDIILMDIQLNGLSGIDLIRELKHNESTKDIPVIAITAFAIKSEEIKIMASGCDKYLSKPVTINNFYQAVDDFLTKEVA